MTRAGLLLLLLAGCMQQKQIATDLASVSYGLIRDPQGHVVYQPCGQGHQCAVVRQGDELLVMGHPSRIGDEAAVFDTIGVTVKAFSEDR